jgi:hypothetical protein
MTNNQNERSTKPKVQHSSKLKATAQRRKPVEHKRGQSVKGWRSMRH